MNLKDRIIPGFVYLHESEWNKLLEKSGCPTKKGALEIAISIYLDSPGNPTEQSMKLKEALERKIR